MVETLLFATSRNLNRIHVMNASTLPNATFLITLEEAAERLKISRRTLERLIAAHEFPRPLKIGRASRVDVSDVDAFCEQLRAKRVQN